ncbi:MAG: SH3-like domain-containing protein [Cyanobacteria bacterium P01_H01_bin.21]
MKEVAPKAYHQPIPHNPEDQESISTVEETVSFFEKQIVSIHNLMRAKQQLPSFDSVRRAAEEIDGRFDSQTFSVDIPAFLRSRLPRYGERRILAVETVLCELGYLTREELRQGFKQANKTDDSASLQQVPDIPYSPEIDQDTYAKPGYAVGDWVQVVDQIKTGHIRTPVYVLGKRGKVAHLQGLFLNPEDLAHFKPRVLQLPLYLVEFEMVEVWGDRCPQRSRRDKLRVEIYEPWLKPLS